MLDSAAFSDFRSFIKRRIAYARYRVGTTYTKVIPTDISILGNGTVRVFLSINPETAVTVNRVELWSNNNELWAHQDCSITVSADQTGILFWFDFSISEIEG